MESRDKIIEKILKELLKVLEGEDNIIEFNLEKYNNYFLSEEIEEYNKKIEIITYLDKGVEKKEFFKSNIEVLIFAIKDIEKFLFHLKNKKKEFVYRVFDECLDSIKDFERFYNFIFNSEFYFENYSHYFSDKERREYKNKWNNLEEELAIILSINNRDEIEKKWEENYFLVIKRVKEMLLFLNSIL